MTKAADVHVSKPEDAQSDLKPRPDPTDLTRAMLIAEIAKLRELLLVHIESLDKTTALRFEHMKEVMSKAEMASVKQIDAMGVLLCSQAGAIDEKIGDLKERLTRSEGHGSGVAISWAVAVAVVGILIAFAGLLIALMRKG